MLAIQRNDERELHNAVWSVQTNYILKKLAKTLYNRESYRNKMPKLVSLLKVDIQTCTPIYFNEMVYKKKEHEECHFLFLDKDFKLMAILEGNGRDEKVFSNIEYYEWDRGYGGYEVKKNRKNLTAEATHILMITPEMRTYVKKNKPKAQPRFLSKKAAKDSLNSRLAKYKKAKHESLSIEECKAILVEALSYFSSKMFLSKEEQLKIARHFKKPIWFADSVTDLIRGVSDIAKDFNYESEKHERAKERGSLYEFDWAGEALRKLKADIGILKKKLEEVK